MTASNPALRSLLVYAVVLPLALVLGYLMATPLDPSTFAVVGLVLLLICSPLLLRWHYPLLFLSWNSLAFVFFLPGRPQLWLVMVFVSLGISVIQRTISRDMRFISATSVVLPLVFLGGVVYWTARQTGGFNMAVFGGMGGTVGGKRYLLIFAGIVGFLAMLAHPIPRQKAATYVGMYLLGNLGNAISSSLPYLSSSLYFIYLFFPVENEAYGSLASGVGTEGVSRFYGFGVASMSIYFYLLARYGIKDLITGRSLWRSFLFVGAALLTTGGGFRSSLIMMGMTFFAVFCFEGLLRSKYAVTLGTVCFLGCVLLVPFATKLPLPIQRTLSVLPIEVDPVARMNAQASSEWRVRMWKMVATEVPKYFWFGKGLGIAGQDLELTSTLAQRGGEGTEEVAMLAGDYHNGPLSVIIPFGVWGALGWLWFLAASIRALYFNYRFGDESLKKINTFLLAYFLAKTLLFFVVFGGFYSDLAVFVGLVGLNLALNGGICKPVRVLAVAERVSLQPRALLKPALNVSRS